MKVTVEYWEQLPGFFMASSPDDKGFLIAGHSIEELQQKASGAFADLRKARGESPVEFDIEYKEARK